VLRGNGRRKEEGRAAYATANVAPRRLDHIMLWEIELDSGHHRSDLRQDRGAPLRAAWALGSTPPRICVVAGRGRRWRRPRTAQEEVVAPAPHAGSSVAANQGRSWGGDRGDGEVVAAWLRRGTGGYEEKREKS
jgi:hypothetical protein